MSDNGIDAKLLHDLILASTKANESMKNSLASMTEAIGTLADSSCECKAFIEAIQTEKKTFYQYTVKTFLWVFAILVMIIGSLLWKMNIKGADAVTSAPSSVLNLMQ